MQTNKYKIEFGFGVGLDRNQNPISLLKMAAAVQAICTEAAKLFKAYTLTEVNGGWTNPAGVLVTERGYTLTVIMPSTQFTQAFAKFIGGALDQEAVAVTVTPVNFNVIFI